MDKWTAIVAVVVVGGLAAGAWQVLKPETAAQGHSMEMPDTSKLPTGAPLVEVRLPAELSDQAQLGKKMFDAKCATCHGTNAAGQNGVAPPLVHKIYEPNHHADMAFIMAAQNGVRSHHWTFGNMPPVEGVTQGDVKMIVRYVRELQQENGIN